MTMGNRPRSQARAARTSKRCAQKDDSRQRKTPICGLGERCTATRRNLTRRRRARDASHIQFPTSPWRRFANVLELFTRLARDKLPAAYLLTRDDGKRWAHSDWDELVRDAATRAELPKGTCLYTLRHSFITQALLDSMSTLEVTPARHSR